MGSVDEKVEKVFARLPDLFSRLLACPPARVDAPPPTLPRCGVYLFSYPDAPEARDRPVYVGRSDNMRDRLAGHRRASSTHFSASLAFRLARRALGLDGMLADTQADPVDRTAAMIAENVATGGRYRDVAVLLGVSQPPSDARRAELAALNRASLSEDPDFGRAFDRAKAWVGRLELRFVDVEDPPSQALLEIYAAIALETPFNEWKNH